MVMKVSNWDARLPPSSRKRQRYKLGGTQRQQIQEGECRTFSFFFQAVGIDGAGPFRRHHNILVAESIQPPSHAAAFSSQILHMVGETPRDPAGMNRRKGITQANGRDAAISVLRQHNAGRESAAFIERQYKIRQQARGFVGHNNGGIMPRQR